MTLTESGMKWFFRVIKDSTTMIPASHAFPMYMLDAVNSGLTIGLATGLLISQVPGLAQIAAALISGAAAPLGGIQGTLSLTQFFMFIIFPNTLMLAIGTTYSLFAIWSGKKQLHIDDIYASVVNGFLIGSGAPLFFIFRAVMDNMWLEDVQAEAISYG